MVKEAPLKAHLKANKASTDMKINEGTEVRLDLKTVVSIIAITAAFVGMYFTLKADIEEAKKLPPSDINRIEYDLHQKAIDKSLIDINNRINDAEEMLETMFMLGVELDKELHKIDDGYNSNMDAKIKQIERQIITSQNSKRNKRK